MIPASTFIPYTVTRHPASPSLCLFLSLSFIIFLSLLQYYTPSPPVPPPMSSPYSLPLPPPLLSSSPLIPPFPRILHHPRSPLHPHVFLINLHPISLHRFSENHFHSLRHFDVHPPRHERIYSHSSSSPSATDSHSSSSFSSFFLFRWATAFVAWWEVCMFIIFAFASNSILTDPVNFCVWYVRAH